MALLEALALHGATRVFTALVSGDAAALQALPHELVRAFFGEVLSGVDAQVERLERIEQKLDIIIDQDYARDFDAARSAMRDAIRSSANAETEADLLEAWTRLRSAAAGTQDPLRRADALYLAAVVALLRRRPSDALDRAQTTWNVAIASLLSDWEDLVRKVPVPAMEQLRGVFHGPQPQEEKLDSAARCLEACRRAAEASLILGEFKQPGHPTRFNPKSEVRGWAGTAVGINWSGIWGKPHIYLLGDRTVSLPTGGHVAYDRTIGMVKLIDTPGIDYLQERLSKKSGDPWLSSNYPPDGSICIKDTRFVNDGWVRETGDFEQPWSTSSSESLELWRSHAYPKGSATEASWVEVAFARPYGESPPWNAFLRNA